MMIYIDNCCYNRPFDGYMDSRSIAEVSDMMAILVACKRTKYSVFGSPVVEEEIDKMRKSKPEKWAKVLEFYKRTITNRIALTPKIVVRAQEFMTVWPEKTDCYHLALAEAAGADFLITTDDRFEKANARFGMSIVNVINPINLLLEIEKWEQ